MIQLAVNIEGYEFKYISDELYINGKRVANVFANGNHVYPELIEYGISLEGSVRSNTGMLLSTNNFYYEIDGEEEFGHVDIDTLNKIECPDCWTVKFDIEAYSNFPLYYYDRLNANRLLVSYLPGTNKRAYNQTIIANIKATYETDTAAIDEYLKKLTLNDRHSIYTPKLLSSNASKASNPTKGEFSSTVTGSGYETAFTGRSSEHNGRRATFGNNFWDGHAAEITGDGIGRVPAKFLVYNQKAVSEDNPSGFVEVEGYFIVRQKWRLPDDMPFNSGTVINPPGIEYMNESEYLASL